MEHSSFQKILLTINFILILCTTFQPITLCTHTIRDANFLKLKSVRFMPKPGKRYMLLWIMVREETMRWMSNP